MQKVVTAPLGFEESLLDKLNSGFKVNKSDNNSLKVFRGDYASVYLGAKFNSNFQRERKAAIFVCKKSLIQKKKAFVVF